MVGSLNSINAVASGITASGQTQNRVMAAIQRASTHSGVDFSYLLNKAAQESSLNPVAKAKSSSATGLYQFIDQTWLKTIKEHGADYGLQAEADKITLGRDGVARVTNAADKKAILALRNDPEISANMAAELAKANKESLEKTVGDKVGSTELYMAHFLGAGGATAFLKTMQVSPDAKAADILPKAASANPNVFYDKATGQPRSLSEIYSRFAQKFDKSPDMEAMTRMAQAGEKAATKLAANTNTSNQTPAPILAPTGSTQPQMTRRAYAGLDRKDLEQSLMTLNNGVQLNNQTSSPFAAMMLAQMDMESFSLDAQSKASTFMTSEEDRRKALLNQIASAG